METETGSVQENRYDAEGLRFELLENGRRTSFVYHDGELLQEEGREEQGTSYHLGAGMEAFRRGQELSYYHRDEQLSTVFVTDGQGEIRNSYQYDAFGIPLETTEQLNNRIRYTGQQYDDVTGQYYLRARYYNPVAGRFMQEDVYQGDGLNLYAYCGNNPVVYDDPSGYERKACPPQGKISESVDESDINSIDDIALKHSSVGDFTYNPKTGQISRMKGGGHGQSNINFLEENGIEYNIVKEYDNGVRVGNVPKHKTPSKRTGTGQAWFPKNWSDSKIKEAGNYVTNLPDNKNLPDGVIGYGEYDGVRVGIIKTDGKIGTIFPDADLQP